MSQHDKHQYFFEKYLRNDMPAEERVVFEQKLEGDASLRMAFEYYKLNRQKLLEQLIEEHQLTKKDGRLNKLIFLLISLTGIILVASHFLNKPAGKDESAAGKHPNIIVRYIPFLNWENRSDKKAEDVASRPKIAPPKTNETETPIETLEPSLDRNERLASDEFLGDTFVTIWEKNYFDKWVAQRQNDSLGTDSLVKKTITNPSRDKTKKILVEFWESPVSYKGYLFTENKLVVYGLPFPVTVVMYKSQDTTVVVLPNGKFSLIDLPNFIRF
jgi:hypothetical protein